MSGEQASLQGCVALVTGGAGGLGAGICQALAEEGASVVVGYHRSAGPATALAAQLPARAGDAGATHCALHAPVTDSAALARLAVEVTTRYGRCDMLVNCAGTTRFIAHDELDALDDALFDEIFATNVRGPFAVVRAFRQLLEQSERALVVNVSSIAAVTAMGSNVAYCASKAALDNLTRSLARALAPRIRVLAVSPGLADTEFVKAMDAGWRNEQAARTPLRRLAQPGDVARAVLACATHLSFTTGAVIPVDGGRPLA